MHQADLEKLRARLDVMTAQRDSALSLLEERERRFAQDVQMLVEEQDRFVSRLIAGHEAELAELRTEAEALKAEVRRLRRELTAARAEARAEPRKKSGVMRRAGSGPAAVAAPVEKARKPSR